jgi:putative AlgH/UPF0301 family transcriptional regulator
VIINRPTNLKLEGAAATRYPDALFSGGPVMREVIVALFRSDSKPEAPAFHVLKDLYLSMHPQNLQALLEGSGRRYRLYAGFSGWAPRQLESEMMRDGWYVLPADVETVFRKDVTGIWQELVQRAEKRPIAFTQNAARQMKSPAVGGAVSPETPGGAARAALLSKWHEATLGTRGNAASFCGTAVGIRTVARNPAFPRLGNPATVREFREKKYHCARADSRENESFRGRARCFETTSAESA